MAYAVLGPKGTFSEEAAALYWGERVDLQVARDIPEVFKMVAGGQVKAALVPLENSRAGTISASMECLQDNQVKIRGEISIPVQQHLMACRRYALDEIELLISQPVVLHQCQTFIKTSLPGIRTEICDSTARAAQMLRQETRRAASIGNNRTARLYGLQVIQADIAEPDNITRFVHIASGGDDDAGDKCSMIFSLQDRPGALYEALGVFASRRLNLSRIESRPSRGNPAEYSFYIEVDLTAGPDLSEVINELSGYCREIKYLGRYKKAPALFAPVQ